LLQPDIPLLHNLFLGQTIGVIAFGEIPLVFSDNRIIRVFPAIGTNLIQQRRDFLLSSPSSRPFVGSLSFSCSIGAGFKINTGIF
jgi:hypothetical protein